MYFLVIAALLAAEPAAELSEERARQILPRADLHTLTAAQRAQFLEIAGDTFDYAGCNDTLARCLGQDVKDHHALRMTELIKGLLLEGYSPSVIIEMVERYYSSFPAGKRQKLEDTECPQLGSPQAPVVVEFSDFECPHCAAARPILEKFARSNPDSVRFCFSPFPLAGHLNSGPAAQAALFARDQGKFWEMHDLLFENQKQLNPELLKSLASKIGLSPAELSKAIESGRYADELNIWKDSANRARVDSTPTVYVNGRKDHLPISAEALQRTVEDETEWISHNNSWAPD